MFGDAALYHSVNEAILGDGSVTALLCGSIRALEALVFRFHVTLLAHFMAPSAWISTNR